MADDKKAVETFTRGNELEVVSLTASAYPAAPSVKGYQDVHLDVEESALALFMSDHFVFPPAEHENLPIEHEEREAHGNYSEEQSKDQRKVSETAVDESNGVTDSAMVGKDEKPGLPCEGWWKRQKVMHSHPNGSNAILTVGIAATLMGLLIIGKRLQKVVPSAT